MNILITGGYGAIGRKLVVELDKINHVKLLQIIVDEPMLNAKAL